MGWDAVDEGARNACFFVSSPEAVIPANRGKLASLSYASPGSAAINSKTITKTASAIRG